MINSFAIPLFITFHLFDLDQSLLRDGHLSVLCSTTVEQYTYERFLVLGLRVEEIFVRDKYLCTLKVSQDTLFEKK